MRHRVRSPMALSLAFAYSTQRRFMQRTHSWIPRLFPPSIVLLTVAALALTSVSTEAQETPPSQLCPDGHLCQALLDELDALIPGQLKTFDVPGAGQALIDNGQVVYSKGFGVRNLQTGAPFTPDTVYRIGSVSKAMPSM